MYVQPKKEEREGGGCFETLAGSELLTVFKIVGNFCANSGGKKDGQKILVTFHKKNHMWSKRLHSFFFFFNYHIAFFCIYLYKPCQEEGNGAFS